MTAQAASGRSDDTRSAIVRLTFAFRTLDERGQAATAPHYLGAISFVAALGRRLTEVERRYTAVVFGERKDLFDQFAAKIAELIGNNK